MAATAKASSNCKPLSPPKLSRENIRKSKKLMPMAYSTKVSTFKLLVIVQD